MRFPYLQRGPHTYPIVPITLAYQNKVLRTEGLLDTGANISLFPADIADYLGISVDTGHSISLSGIGGRILGYRHAVTMTVGAIVFQSTIVFSAEYISSFNILGRDNFFEQFRITFNERLQFVDIEESMVS